MASDKVKRFVRDPSSNRTPIKGTARAGGGEKSNTRDCQEETRGCWEEKNPGLRVA